MAAFFALLYKEFTLRRKSCCAITVHLIIPIILIAITFGFKLLFEYLESKRDLVGPDEAYLLQQNTDKKGPECEEYSNNFQVNYYVNGLERSTFSYETRDDFKCSFEPNRCPLRNKWLHSSYNSYKFDRVKDANEVTEAITNRSLDNLSKAYKDYKDDMYYQPYTSLVGLLMNYADNALDLTYSVANDAASTKDEVLTMNLKIFHFGVMEKAYSKFTENETNATQVFLSLKKDVKASNDFASDKMLQAFYRTGHVTVTYISMISLTALVRNILYEKRSKLKDMIHMSGVGNFMYYASYFVFDLVIVLILNTLALIIVTPATLEYYVITVVYSVAVTLFAIAFTVFFTSEALGLTLFLLLLAFDIIRSIIGFETLVTELVKSIPGFVQLLMAIYPNFGLKIAFDQLDNRRPNNDYGRPQKLNHLQLFRFDWKNNPAFLQPQFILISMIVSWFFYNFIIFYIGEIWPWQSGTPRSPLFPLAKLRPAFVSKRLDPDKNAGSPEFEPEPNDLKVGIVVNNVKKRYGFSKLVLKGVFLKVFHGQISVLLGHNGAGKTTLMSIITGIDSATSGKVLINGVDTDYEPTKARRGIGMCPQINSQYDTLTVWQHLKFFGMLKGYPKSQLNQEIYRILNLVKLTDAHNRNSKALSGGMKRRLQLGMAFIGGSRILILDEPSSGLDVEARRVVWDMLLAVKREYLIFMTTHHMEEADCLGDRVIIMHDGEIRCIGSPMFLKRVYGVGMTLRVSKAENFQPKACLDFIQRYLNSAKLTKETQTEALYVFAKTEEPNLPQFLKDLEPIRSEFGITSCGVAITTMDDVFVIVGEKYDVKKGDSQGLSKLTIEGGQKLLRPTCANSFIGLFVKRFHVTKRSKLFYFVMVFTILFSILCGLVFLKSSSQIIDGYKVSFELDDKYGYTCIPNDAELCKTTFNDSLTDESKLSAFTIEVKQNPVFSCLLIIPQKGQEFGAITETFRGLMNGVQVQPEFEAARKRMVLSSQKTIKLALCLIPYWSFLLSLLPIRAVVAEKRTNVKLLQLMTGISPITYWLSHFVFDYLLALVISSPMLLLLPVFYFATGQLVFNQLSIAALYYVGFLYFIFSCIIWSYVASNVPFGKAAGIQTIIYYLFIEQTVNVFALVIALSSEASQFPKSLIHYGSLLIFWLASASPFSQFSRILTSIYYFSDKIALCNNLFEAFDKIDVCNGGSWTELWNVCCNSTNSGGVWKELLGPIRLFSGKELDNSFKYSFVIPLLLAIIVLMLFIALILGLEYIKIIMRKRTRQVRNSVGEEDLDVYNERMATEAVLAGNGQIYKALVIKDLTKKYGKFFVVNRLTVTVERNQIFGFLGVNGAGKTTAFKMMVGEINRTGGEAYIGQYSLSINFQTYRAQIGYCPQFDAFVTGLTGKEMLYLFARLRGIQRSQIKQAVNQMINLVDLQDYANVVADNYSGGNKRKLSAAMALIGYPKVIFLDEPTAAVDPVARRKIWKVMEYARQATGSSIVLTSHALDECEALCEKIVVMVAGQLKCLGSLQHLKQKFGQGLHITAKTKPGYNNLPQVQEAIVSMVPSSRVVDSHTNVTIVHVTDPQVKIGDVYGVMEQIKVQFDLEDYQVEETNLERIFLYFAKAAYGVK